MSMYQVSTQLAEALATQRLHVRVTCGNTVLDSDRVTNLTYSASCGGGEVLTIGGVTAASVTMTITGRVDLLNEIITVEVGALLEGTVTYIPLGTFAVAECQTGEDSVTVTAYDAAYYGMGVSYVPTVQPVTTVAAVLADVASQCGLTLATLPGSAAETQVAGDLTGHTCRDMAGYMAALLGCNALIDRDGQLALRWFSDSGLTVTTEDYYAGGLTLGGSHALTGIVCTVPTGDESETLYVGDATGDQLILELPYMTQSRLEAVWEIIGGLSYMEGTCNMVGGLLLEPGDIITVTDSTESDSVIPVMELSLTLDGGCQASVTAVGESSTAADANVTGPLNAAVSDAAETAKAAYSMASEAEETASGAMIAANGKNKVFHQATAPASSVGLQTGDTWFDTADGYKMYTWGGSSWAAEQFGVNAIADLSITNAKIANGTIESAKISTLDAGKITSGTIATARLDVNAIFAQNVTATGTITGATLSGGSITGTTITTTSGSIGGWSIGQYMLYTNTSANRIFLQQADGSSRVNVFAVQSLTNTSYYPFRIAYDGTLVSRNQNQYVKLDSGNLYFGDYRMSGAIPRIYGNYDNETGKELNLLCGSSRIEMMENQIDINSDATNGCTFYCPAHFLDSVLCYEDVSCDGDLICEGQAEAGSVRSGRFTDSASNIIFQRYKNGSNPEYPIYWNNAGILRIATKTTNKTPASDNGTSFIIANGLYAAGSVDSTPSVTSAHVYLAGGCDATSRWIGSPAVYGRTYNAAANVYVTSNGYLGRATSSSIKYKHDVEYLTNEGFSAINKGEPHPSKKGCDTSLESVLDIPVVTFKYNEGYVTGEADFDYDKPIAGFIAEDVARVCPECATYVEDENGDRVPEAWDAKQLLVRMLYVLQRQQDEIKQLKERMVS